jgi:acyl carrier protein
MSWYQGESVGFLDKLRGKKTELITRTTEPITEASVQEWLVTHIAAVAQIQPEDVDIDRPFAEFGMDSMQLFQLSGDLQKVLGREVSEIVAWDYPTVTQLSRHLASDTGTPASAGLVDDDELVPAEPQQ